VELDYDIEELEAKFKNWETTLTKTVDVSLSHTLKVFDDCEIPITRMTIPNKAHPSKFFRARIISSNSCEDLSDPKTYSYPPIANTKSYQRANVPGYPVFYGALDAHTALEEIKKPGVEPLEKDDIIFLSEWRLKEGADITLNYLTLPEIIEENQLYSMLTRKVYKELKELFSEKGAKYVDYQLALFERISRLFLGENYLQSSVIAYNIMFLTPKIEGLKIDGIIYPSCSNQFRSVNCALSPEFVDDNLELVGVSKLKFNQFSDLGAEVSNTYVGTFDGNKISWTSQVSELLTDEYDTIFISELQWDEAKTTAAHFYFNSEITDLDTFCKQELKSTDKFKEIKSKEGIPLDLSKKLACIYELNVDSKSTFLKSGNEINPIHMLQLVIPLKTFTQEITQTEVLKG
jgi:hypothetical protein